MQDLPELRTITRTYPTFEDARNVVVRLVQAGISPDHIGLLGQQAGGEDNTAAGAGVGAAAGAATGFVLGLGSLALPGIGPIIAAGWFLSGAIAGSAAGGVIGALVDAGSTTAEAEAAAAEHKQGQTVVSARVEGRQIETATAVMDAAISVSEAAVGSGAAASQSSSGDVDGRADDLSKVVS